MPADRTEAGPGDAEDLLSGSLAGGVAVAVTAAEGILAEEYHGLADIGAGRPVEPGTLFEIGSISKGFTCALLLRAREERLLDLDEPVRAYLPWFEVRSRFPITLRHLMTHTGGIVMGTEVSGDAAFEVWSLRDTEATAEPGTYFHYSNVGYKALGLVLEAVHNRPYHQILRERALKPLGMAESEAAITHDIRRRLAVGYEPLYDDRPADRSDGLVPATWVETATADGSIASTARDMTAWLRLLLRGGARADGRPLLAAASFDELLAPAIETDDGPHGSFYGLGLWTAEINGHRHAGHSGGMVGYHSAIVCDLDERVGAVVLANGTGPWRELALHRIAAIRAKRTGAPAAPFAPPRPQPVSAAPSEPPGAWAPYVGHYRCHNPWVPNLRVRVHGGRPWVEFPSGDVPSPEEPLTPLVPGRFRVGEDERSPERLVFDTPIGGVTTRAIYSGCPLYRTFTP